jgi:small subunit ribosomal protein S8
MDKIANIFSHIQNTQKRGNSFIRIPSSKIIQNILNCLFIEGYIKGFSFISKGKNSFYILYLSSSGYQSTGTSFKQTGIQKIIRISKPGKRIYTNIKDLQKVKRGLGTLLVSTSNGILTDRDARFLRKGGEILGQIF